MEKDEYKKILEKNYKIMFSYANKIYPQQNRDIADIVHTIFIRLWEMDKIPNFENENKVKNYIRISIKNFLFSKNKEAKWLKKETFKHDPLWEIEE